ncbi:discoidin domain-containing protein [Oscillochloris sp. ZM17-4]|uniref:discoidin domain-containing protein n=1 Tax=Oscillochloris sp. ZM17-4 TaxID=2866714 RepID=UPI001C73766C|nr:discoidin domain-containing protein [Oscillochloris sp. ZM17-4]MBX0328258.1 discoidin domain-containing protein [Oscillochloris sp. ZM17-4]
MARKVVQLDLTTGELVVTPDMTEASEVQTTPTASGIPRADGAGQIAAGWIPDAVRTVNVEEPDGVPALTDIDTLVFDAGTVAFLGGGKARITGGGGDTINLQGRPLAANAPEVGQALVWTGSTWAPGTIAGGGGSDWLTAVQLIGLVDGVNQTFDLPAPAIPSSLSVYIDDGGNLTEVPFTMASYENVVLGITPTANGFNSGGFYGSSPSSCLVDGAITGSYWSSGNTQPVVSWGLPEAKAVSRVAAYASTNGGFGGMASYMLEYSDDNVTWLTAATNITSNVLFTLTAQDPHVWWRITGLSRWNGYEWSAIEMVLEAALATVETVIFDAAPAIGTVPRASFRVAPTIETGGGSSGSGTHSGPGGLIYLFNTFI